MPSAGFQPAIQVTEHPQSYALDRKATSVGESCLVCAETCSWILKNLLVCWGICSFLIKAMIYINFYI